MTRARRMPRPSPVVPGHTRARRWTALLGAATVAAGGGLLVSPATPAAAVPERAPEAAPAQARAQAPGHDRLVAAVPKAGTPNVRDESVNTIYAAGDTVIAGGDFSRIRGADAGSDTQRPFIFAFDADTGALDTDFTPDVDGEVTAIIGGPTPGTVYIGGRFSHVGDVATRRSKVALLNVSDGSVVRTFLPPAIDGAVTDLALAGDQLLVGGNFTTVGQGTQRRGLASLDATTGQLTDYLIVQLTENHHWTPDSTDVARAAVGVERMAISPDASRLVAVGNFKRADGVVHDQIVKINLGDAAATVANWDTERFRAVCGAHAIDSYLRDVAFSPDGEYFVTIANGGSVPGTLCDSAARWEADATGAGQQPTWTSFSGGDSLLSVGISEQAVYVGGHMRWMNNDLGNNAAGPGAVPRASMAALDPANGVPMSWNPGRNPRGFGVVEFHVTADGLWVGHDQEWIGNFEYRRERIAFFPLAGGQVPHPTATPSLPNNIYAAGRNAPSPVLLRVNAGGPQVAAVDGGPNWQADTAAAPSRYHNTGLATYTHDNWLPDIKAPVSGAMPREIFNSARANDEGAEDQHWDIPIAEGTQVAVRLYFASRCVCSAGRRLFNINIDGVRRATNFDVIEAAGGNEIGVMQPYTATSDGNIDIDLLFVRGQFALYGIEIVRSGVVTPVGDENDIHRRSYDGAEVGARTEVPNAANFPWNGARGAFLVGGTLFFQHGSAFYRSSFDRSLGAYESAYPYSDAKWNTVITNSAPAGQTYAGLAPEFFHEKNSLSGMFYDNGRLYYTLAGHPKLYWRGFSPDSGVIGAVRHTVDSDVSFADAGDSFVAGGRLYVTNRLTGTMARLNWTDGVPTGTATIVSGPDVDGADWRAKAVFVAP